MESVTETGSQDRTYKSSRPVLVAGFALPLLRMLIISTEVLLAKWLISGVSLVLVDTSVNLVLDQ